MPDDINNVWESAIKRIADGGAPLDGLHKDLLPYVRRKNGYTMISHPLVVQMVPLAEMANASYLNKRERVKELLHNKEYEKAIWIYEKPYRLDVLITWWKSRFISVDVLKELLPDVWITVEFPSQNGVNLITSLFKDTGFLTDSPTFTPLAPEEILTVYRGAYEGHKRGMSWTLDKSIAEFFARRLVGGGAVYSAQIPANGVLAYFEDRGESEIVVNYRMLKNIKRIEKVDQDSV